MKTSHKILHFTVGAVSFLALVISPAIAMNYYSNIPTFKVGDIICLDVKKESWDTGWFKNRIEELGEDNYRVSSSSDKHPKFTESLFSIRYRGDSNYELCK